MTDNNYKTGAIPELITKPDDPLSIDPFWSIKNEDQAILEWYTEKNDILRDWKIQWMNTYLNNVLLYQSSYYKNQDQFGNYYDDQGQVDKRSLGRVVMPELYEYTDNRVNRTLRSPTKYHVYPGSMEHSDIRNAKTIKALLDYVDYMNNLGRLMRWVTRNSIIAGQQTIFIGWDNFCGDLDPKWVKAKESEATNTGKKKGIVKVDGEEFEFDPEYPMFLGNMDFRVPMEWEIDYDPQGMLGDTQWMTRERWRHVEEVVWEDRMDENSKGKNEKAIRERVGNGFIFDAENLGVKPVKNHVLQFEIFQRAGKYSVDGRYVKGLPGLILCNEELRYPRTEESDLGNLPFEVLTDVDIPNHKRGFSTFQLLAPLNHTLNQMYSALKRNFMFAGSPQIAIPFQSRVKIEQIGNDATTYYYRHPYLPTTVQPHVIPAEAVQLIDVFSKKLMQIEGRSSTSGGQMPSNVRSAKQIALIEELEQLRSEERKQKKDETYLSMIKKVKADLGKFLVEKGPEERLVHILGRNKKPMLQSLNVAVLNKPYDIRIAPASALSDVPTERVNQVAQLLQTPGMMELYSKEQWAYILDLGLPAKFFDEATSAADKAAWENEMFTDGDVPPLPLEADDHYVHWRMVIALIRSVAFLHFSEKQQEACKRHAMLHEKYIFKNLKENPIAAQRIAMLSAFPALLKPPTPPQPPMPPGMGPGGPGGPQQPPPAQGG